MKALAFGTTLVAAVLLGCGNTTAQLTESAPSITIPTAPPNETPAQAYQRLSNGYLIPLTAVENHISNTESPNDQPQLRSDLRQIAKLLGDEDAAIGAIQFVSGSAGPIVADVEAQLHADSQLIAAINAAVSSSDSITLQRLHDLRGAMIAASSAADQASSDVNRAP